MGGNRISVELTNRNRYTMQKRTYLPVQNRSSTRPVRIHPLISITTDYKHAQDGVSPSIQCTFPANSPGASNAPAIHHSEFPLF